MEYLEKYNFTPEEVTKIRKKFNKDIVSKFQIMEDNVTKVLDYLTNLGITSFYELITKRPDICFMDINILKEKTEKIDAGLLKFVFENEVDNLLDFDI